MKNNTVVTAGDRHYLWGVYLLIASMRRNGMEEPVLVLGVDYDREICDLLAQFGEVTVVSIPPPARSLACHKPDAMLLARTEYVTWADSDGFFLGNNSADLPPRSPEEIHIRMRGEAENARAFRGRRFGEDGRSIPREVVEAWRRDVGSEAAPAIPRACSDCLLSVHRSQRPLLRRWREQMQAVLPEKNVGVVDRTVRYYHQLDESVLNSLLCLWEGAPRVSASYRLDKEPRRRFIHFVCRPKPWTGWTASSFPHFDAYLDVAEYCTGRNLKLPGPLPFSLRRENRDACRSRLHLVELTSRIAAKLKGIFR